MTHLISLSIYTKRSSSQNAAAAGRPKTSAQPDTEFVQKIREGELYASMVPPMWCPVTQRALPGCSPGPRKGTTNCEPKTVQHIAT